MLVKKTYSTLYTKSVEKSHESEAFLPFFICFRFRHSICLCFIILKKLFQKISFFYHLQHKLSFETSKPNPQKIDQHCFLTTTTEILFMYPYFNHGIPLISKIKYHYCTLTETPMFIMSCHH